MVVMVVIALCSSLRHNLVPMERLTRQRTAIFESIEAACRPLLPQEVLKAAQISVPTLSLATVYRQLKLLVESGDLHPVLLPGECARYEPARQKHHHHFQCNYCHRVFDVHTCPGNLDSMAPAGFTVENHDLTLYGSCNECGRRKQSP